tara:strand:- start:1694 stop:2689 length:996 start_codon:yes stop_codon:yes gene_type:complete
MIKKIKKIALITGGAGFIGSHLVDLLISKNFEVRVIDNLTGGRLKNLSHHKKNKNFKFKKLDINKIKKNEKFFKNVKYVYHLAGIGDIVPSIEKPSDYLMTNAQGTVNILEASKFFKVKKFVYAASSSCYGINNKRIDERGIIAPQYPYALSKNLGEQIALHWNKVYKLPVNSIRIFNAYGPRVRTTGAYGAVFGVFFKQKLKNFPFTIVGNGKQARDFIYVSDVAEAFFKASTTSLSGEVFNLGNDNPQTINTLANLIGGKKTYIPERPGEPKKTWANISKIKRQLKWKPKVDFKEGVKEMLKKIDLWRDAPLWNRRSIKVATKIWFKYL